VKLSETAAGISRGQAAGKRTKKAPPPATCRRVKSGGRFSGCPDPRSGAGAWKCVRRMREHR